MKLLLKILLSVLLSFVILKALDYAATLGLRHNKDFKIAYLTKHTIGADLLIHGPCVPEWSIDPEVLQTYMPYHCFNLAQNHADFADNYLFLYTYLKHQPKPKAVLLYASPESFDSSATNTFNTYRFAFLLGDDEINKVVADMDPAFYKISHFPFLRYSYYSNFIFYKAISGYVNWITRSTTPRRSTGYTEPDDSYTRAIGNFRDLNPQKERFLWSSKREKYFLKISELLQKEHIKLIVYESPLYYEALPFQQNRKERVREIDSVCSNHHIAYFQFDTLAMKYDKRNYFSANNTTIAGNKIFNSFLGIYLRDTLPAIISK